MSESTIIHFVISVQLVFISIVPQIWAQESLREASDRYIAIQAASGVVEQLKNKQIPGIVNDSKKYILSDVNKHQKKTTSESLVKKYAEKALNERFDKDLSAIYQNLGIENTGFSESEYKKEVNKRFNEQIKNNRSTFINNKFQDIFSEARRGAVNQQFHSLKLNLYPSQKEVEQIDDAGWKPKVVASFKENLMQKMKSSVKELFEENKPKVTNAANEVITDIERQRQKQQNGLEDYVSEVAITESQITNELHKNVQTTINEMKSNAKKYQIIYKTFPSVEKKISPKAKNIEKDRFKLFINDFNLSFNNETLKGMVQSNLRSHRKKDDSAKTVAKNLFPDTAEKVVNAYSAKIKSSSDYPTFKNHLKQSISKNEGIRDTLKSRILSAVKTPLGEVRADIAEAQIKRHFYPVFSGEWAVPEKILKKIALNNFGVHSFKQSLELPFISRGSEPYNPSSLLEETENNVLSKVGKLLSEGKRAWDGQSNIIKAKEDVIKDEFNKLTKDKLTLKGEEQWIAYYTKQVEEEWSDNRFNKIWRGFSEPPPNSPTKYAPLLGHMRDEIKKIVHNFFEATKKRIKLEQIEIKEQIAVERQRLEEERLKREEEKQRGPADVGGEQSVEKKEPGSGGAQPHPTNGGVPAKIPWWFWFLLLLLIVVLVLIIVLLYRRLRKKRRLKKVREPKTPWIPIKNLRSISFPVDDLDKSISVFSELVGVQPIKKSATEAVFKKGFFMVVFRKSGQ